MLKQRPYVYLAVFAVLGSLLVVGVPVDRVLFMGFVGFMLMMHLGGHGAHGVHGRSGHEVHGTNEHPVGHGHVTPAPNEDEVAEK